MNIKITTVDKKSYEIVYPDMPSLTWIELFDQFLNHFRNNGWWKVTPTTVISYHSVIRVEIV